MAQHSHTLPARAFACSACNCMLSGALRILASGPRVSVYVPAPVLAPVPRLAHRLRIAANEGGAGRILRSSNAGRAAHREPHMHTAPRIRGAFLRARHAAVPVPVRGVSSGLLRVHLSVLRMEDTIRASCELRAHTQTISATEEVEELGVRHTLIPHPRPTRNWLRSGQFPRRTCASGSSLSKRPVRALARGTRRRMEEREGAEGRRRAALRKKAGAQPLNLSDVLADLPYSPLLTQQRRVREAAQRKKAEKENTASAAADAEEEDQGSGLGHEEETTSGSDELEQAAAILRSQVPHRNKLWMSSIVKRNIGGDVGQMVADIHRFESSSRVRDTTWAPKGDKEARRRMQNTMGYQIPIEME
ncbi:hypothetical protein FB451DRAFT_1178236 [Mycena latifolia]|nr:hypothetical protein FB451DRAFT_1178236 [Mycena latifolia]